MTDLSPAQTAAFDELIKALPIGNIFVVWSHTGMGKTTILKELHGLKGGKFLTMTDYIQQLSTQDPLKMEETLESILMDAFSSHELVILDDLHLIYDVICGCGYGSAYPRGKYVEAILTSIAGRIIESGKKLILSFEGSIPAPIRSRCYISSIQKFKAADYITICSNILEEKAASLDFQKIHRFAPKLNAHQLNTSALWLKQEDLDTDRFIEYLRSQRMGNGSAWNSRSKPSMAAISTRLWGMRRRSKRLSTLTSARRSPRLAACNSTSASTAASRKPRLTPCPASG